MKFLRKQTHIMYQTSVLITNTSNYKKILLEFVPAVSSQVPLHPLNWKHTIVAKDRRRNFTSAGRMYRQLKVHNKHVTIVV